MRLALGLALVPGLGTGLLLALVAGMQLPITIAWPQLAQAHGQIQTRGFVLVFIVSVGLQLFPASSARRSRSRDARRWGRP
jgi:hypothetical protein